MVVAVVAVAAAAVAAAAADYAGLHSNTAKVNSLSLPGAGFVAQKLVAKRDKMVAASAAPRAFPVARTIRTDGQEVVIVDGLQPETAEETLDIRRQQEAARDALRTAYGSAEVVNRLGTAAETVAVPLAVNMARHHSGLVRLHRIRHGFRRWTMHNTHLVCSISEEDSLEPEERLHTHRRDGRIAGLIGPLTTPRALHSLVWL